MHFYRVGVYQVIDRVRGINIQSVTRIGVDDHHGVHVDVGGVGVDIRRVHHHALREAVALVPERCVVAHDGIHGQRVAQVIAQREAHRTRSPQLVTARYHTLDVFIGDGHDSHRNDVVFAGKESLIHHPSRLRGVE